MCGNIHFEGGGRQSPLQPNLQKREHDPDRTFTVVCLLQAAAGRRGAAGATLERRWMQPAAGWRQQRAAGLGFVVWSPPSASVRQRTGPGSPPHRRSCLPGRSGSRCLSDYLISARFSHRCRSWITRVDIVWPRDRFVTFIAWSARSVRVRSSWIKHESELPSWSCFNALAW